MLLTSSALSGKLHFHRPNFEPSPGSRVRAGKTTISPIEDTFGPKLASGELGVVLSNPMEINGNNLRAASSNLDPYELRRSLLFWDKIAWPCSNGIYFAGGDDEAYLEKIGKIFRPKYSVSGDAATALGQAIPDAYKRLERESPGQWAFSCGERSLIVKDRSFEEGRGVLASLYNAIPVPECDVPLDDILEFRGKRKDELTELRIALDGFFQAWVNSEDPNHQLQLALRTIERRCNQVIRVSRESAMPFRWSNWKIAFSMSGEELLHAATSFVQSRTFGLGLVESALCAVPAFLTFSKDVGVRSPSRDLAPYNFVASVHREFS